MKAKFTTVLLLLAFLVVGAMSTGCSPQKTEVSSKKRSRCITSKPAKGGFLKYVECGYFR